MAVIEYRNALPAGFRLHWYEIEKVLGQGGFGITYLAHDSNLEQAVAIKEYLPSELAVRGDDCMAHPISKDRAPTFAWGLDRFLREGKTLAKFKHPNIVIVHSLFEANNTGYMVMAYEQGASLETVLGQRQTIPEPELLKILLSLLDGLERVHQAGFIHRDIKPANIVMRSDGTPALIDFGSARQAFAGYTRTLTTLVSPGYAPFEQYASEGERQGPWTDIYALGATVYRAITGKTPADAIARNVVLKGQPDPMRPAAEIGRGWYSQHFLEAIDCALAFQEEDRPQNIAEWRHMLLGKREVKRPIAPPPAGAPTVKVTELAETAPTVPLEPPTEKLQKAPIPAPASRGLKWLGVTALLVVVVGTLSYQFVIRQESPPPVDKTVEQATPAPRALEQKTESSEEEIQELVAKAEADMQASRLTSPTGNNALERYRAVLALDPDNLQAQQGLQQIVGAYLKLVVKAQDAQQFDKAEQYLQRAEAIGPNAEDIQHAREQLLATKAQLERQITIKRLLAKAEEDIKATRLTSPKGNNALERFRAVLAVDPDNVKAKQGIARLVDQYVELADKAIAAKQFTKAERYLHNAAAIQPAAAQVQAAQMQLAERRAQTEARLKAEIEQQRKAQLQARREAEAKRKAELEAKRIQDLWTVRTLTGHAHRVQAVAFSPDGRTLASGSWDQTIKLWDTSSGRLQRTLTGHADIVLAVAFSPDGRTLASASRDRTIKLRDVSSGRLQRTLTGHAKPAIAIAFSPDGRTLASGSADKTIKLWDTSSGRLQRTLTGHADIVRAVAFSPDGRTLASGSYDNTIKLWQ